jgi:hypothetical protein
MKPRVFSRKVLQFSNIPAAPYPRQTEGEGVSENITVALLSV